MYIEGFVLLFFIIFKLILSNILLANNIDIYYNFILNIKLFFPMLHNISFQSIITSLIGSHLRNFIDHRYLFDMIFLRTMTMA
jgi:hypothetical protein